MTTYTVHIDTGRSTITREFDTEHLVNAVMMMIGWLPTGSDRQRTRRLLMRRLQHPEVGGNPQTARDVHPKQTGPSPDTGGPVCCRCGWPRRSHNIDGERIDCDGFVEEQ